MTILFYQPLRTDGNYAFIYTKDGVKREIAMITNLCGAADFLQMSGAKRLPTSEDMMPYYVRNKQGGYDK